jgi:hypothetical protein
MEAFLIILLAGTMVGLGMWYNFSRWANAEKIVREWIEQDYRIIAMERRSFFRGPFFWRANKCAVVFWLSAEDNRGHQREGYVMIGTFWMGDLTKESIEVVWS